MKNIIKSVFVFVALTLASVACVKEQNPYQPAEPATGEQVFFPNTISAQIELSKDQTSFDIPVLRNTTALEAIDVAVEASGTGVEIFDIPGTVSFKSGEKESKITINYNPAELPTNVFYDVVLKISDASLTTPYGNAALTFSAGVSLPWIAFDEGIMYETPYWGEQEEKTLYYQQISETIRFCRVPECFGYETIKAGDPYDVQDYTFYWNTETNQIYVPKQWMGYANSNGETWFMDESEFYNWYWAGYGYAAGTDEWFAFCDLFRSKYPGDYYPYYDGNGGFFLADYYTAGEPGTSAYLGRYTGGVGDSFICNSFVRADYTIDAQYAGMFVTPEGSASPVIGFNYTEDVSGIKFVVTDQDTDPIETLMSIIEGTAENVNDVNNLEGDYVEVVVPDVEPGLCSVVAVPYNASEELQADYAVLCDFYFPGTSTEKPEVEGVVMLLPPSKVFIPEYIAQKGYNDYSYICCAFAGVDIQSGKYLLSTSASLSEYADVLEPLLEEEGEDFTDEDIESINDEYGLVYTYSKVPANTEFELLCSMKNKYGSYKFFDVKGSTDPAPAAAAVNAKRSYSNGIETYYPVEFNGVANFNLREGWGTPSRKVKGSGKKNFEISKADEKL